MFWRYKWGSADDTPFNPVSSLRGSESAAIAGTNYREPTKCLRLTAFLFNHDPNLGQPGLVYPKGCAGWHIVFHVAQRKVSTGRFKYFTRLGWAPEYAEAMWLILQAERADDFVIATGEANSLKDLSSSHFLSLGWTGPSMCYTDDQFMRPR